MLSFWKKNNSAKAPSPSTAVKSRNGSFAASKDFEPGRVGPLSSFDPSGIEVRVSDQSHLQLDLRGCLNDKTAQAYFTQFLESRDLVKTLQLYFDVDLICSRNILQNEVARSEKNSIEKPPPSDPLQMQSEGIKFECLSNADGRLTCDKRNCDSDFANEKSGPASPKTPVNTSRFDQISRKVLRNSFSDSFNDSSGHCDKLEKHRRTPSSSDFSPGDRDSSKVSPSKSKQQGFGAEPGARFKDIDAYYSKFEAIMSQGEVTEEMSIELFQLKSVLFQCLQECWSEFINSEFFYKYQVEILTNGSVDLCDILNHETSLSYFMEFLEGEGCQSIVEFWLAASHFQRFLQNCGSEYNAEQAQEDAVIIYDKYLSLQATTPLGFSDTVRCAVELAICRENELPLPNCFEPALNVALSYLKTHSLPAFFSSQHYVRLLSDMIKNSAYKSNSPTSSVSEFSTDSRLSSISSKIDPDFIYRKRQQCGLSLGHIDQLGRFETTIEPEPDKKSESKISRVVRKLVNKGEDKVQEEMAWRVAEMIVKDVTSVTMGGLEDDFS